MANPDYDPVKRREYYLRTRELKGDRVATYASTTSKKTTSSQGTSSTPPKSRDSGPSSDKSQPSSEQRAAAVEKVNRLKGKVKTLEGALTKANAALVIKRRNARRDEKKDSDGKTTAKEKQDAKEYREKNRAKLRQKEKDRREKGSKSSSSGPVRVADMSVDQLETRVTNIKIALVSARKQLADASTRLGQMAHSALVSELNLDQQMLPPTISRKESVKMTADFGGYATRSGLQCADGRTILPGAFADQDGMVVPLVYNHNHKDVDNVLGHCKLEAREDGVYAHAYFNETARGQNAKKQVQHGDIKYLSIFANDLKENLKDRTRNLKEVVHGKIREVSLVLAGANPGAYIDYVNLVHSDGDVFESDEAVITTGLEIELAHAAATEDDERTIQEILDTLDEEQEKAVTYLLSQALTSGGEAKHSGTDPSDADAPNTETGDESGAGEDAEAVENTGETGEEAADATNTETGESGTEAGEDAQHDNTQEDNSMQHNVFDQAGKSAGGARPQVTLSHDAVRNIIDDAVNNTGSLKRSVENYVKHTGIEVGGTMQHGIENIEYLFPDAQTLENSPTFISRRMEWVDKVLGSVRKSPISRIKTITADITPDEARARGYIKGNMKNEEFFALSKRETTPQTIYKKQKLDRDDVIDITTLDVVAWLKAEMKVMLDEELAAAILIGDGRSVGDDDKIKETNIRPVASDAELYVTTVNVNLDDASSSIDELIDAVIENRKYYKGTGQPTFYTTENVIAKFLTVKDNFGRRIYSSLSEVAAALRVTDIVAVEVMERVSDLVGIMVNLADYTLGADKGGQATMFDDFDIDYNKLRYLIETRCSGALTTPKAALVFRKVAGTSALVTPVEPTFDGTTVTVPTVAGVTYHDAEDNTTLTTASPVTLAEGEVLHVIAKPASGKHFANNAEDEWIYTGRA